MVVRRLATPVIVDVRKQKCENRYEKADVGGWIWESKQVEVDIKGYK